ECPAWVARAQAGAACHRRRSPRPPRAGARRAAWAAAPAPPAASYLNIAAIVDAARRSGADAVHPGYGFLSENPAFAEACAQAGLTFIGPPAAALALCGDKSRTRRAVLAAGVPVLSGTDLLSDADAMKAAKNL